MIWCLGEFAIRVLRFLWDWCGIVSVVWFVSGCLIVIELVGGLCCCS